MKLVSFIFWGLVAALIFGVVYLIISHFMILQLYATFDLSTASYLSHALREDRAYASSIIFWIIVLVIALGIYLLYIQRYDVPSSVTITD